MWLADNWKDYEVLDTSAGEKLERWGKYILVRPDPQVIWNTPKDDPLWRKYDARYARSSTGGGKWQNLRLPAQWQVRYKELTFQVKPMNFKHTGVFPEQAANWDFMMETIRRAGRPIRVLNLFAYTGGATVACAAAGAQVCHVVLDVAGGHARHDEVVPVAVLQAAHLLTVEGGQRGKLVIDLDVVVRRFDQLLEVIDVVEEHHRDDGLAVVRFARLRGRAARTAEQRRCHHRGNQTGCQLSRPLPHALRHSIHSPFPPSAPCSVATRADPSRSSLSIGVSSDASPRIDSL